MRNCWKSSCISARPSFEHFLALAYLRVATKTHEVKVFVLVTGNFTAWELYANTFH